MLGKPAFWSNRFDVSLEQLGRPEWTFAFGMRRGEHPVVFRWMGSDRPPLAQQVEHVFRKRQIRSRGLGFQQCHTALDEAASKTDHAVVQVQILPLETEGLADARTGSRASTACRSAAPDGDSNPPLGSSAVGIGGPYIIGRLLVWGHFLPGQQILSHIVVNRHQLSRCLRFDRAYVLVNQRSSHAYMEILEIEILPFQPG